MNSGTVTRSKIQVTEGRVSEVGVRHGTPRRWRAVVVAGFLGVAPFATAGCSRSPAAVPHGGPLHSQFTEAPNFSRFVGTWSAHDTGGLSIGPSGKGTVRIPDFVSCPSCSEADAPLNSISFALTAAAGNRATGSITSSTDAAGQDANGTTVNGEYADGVSVEVESGSAGTGRVVVLTIGGTQLGRFCDAAAGAASECGA